jgi:hypothetical protein
MQKKLSLHREFGATLHHRRLSLVRHHQMKFADALVNATRESLLHVRLHRRVAVPGQHILTAAIRSEEGDDTLGHLVIQHQCIIVRRAGDQGPADARTVQNGHYLVRCEDRPVWLAIVDVCVKDREILGIASGNTAPPRTADRSRKTSVPLPQGA